MPTKYYSGDQINNSAIGGACGTDGREDKCLQDFGVKA
jgi:hypothetical protein